jgi:biotin carboxyl carrier protein
MTTHITIDGRTHKVTVADGTVEVDGKPIPVDIRPLEDDVLSILLTLPDGRTRSFRSIADPSPNDPAVLIEGRRIPYAIADPRSLRATSTTSATAGPRPLKAPMPGRIVRVLVSAGDRVEQGRGCVVIEAMKMQNELKAPKSGVVARLTATVGETVPAGATLLVVE